MVKLITISGRKLCRILEKLGFEKIYGKGSHVRLEKKTNGEIIKLTVPMHDKLKKGTLSRIIKDSKLTEEEFSGFL